MERWPFIWRADKKLDIFCSRPVLPFFHCYFPQRSLHTLLVIHIDWLVNNPNLFLNMCQISNRCQNVLRNLWDVKRVFNGRRKRRWDLCGWIWSLLYVLSFFFIIFYSFLSYSLAVLPLFPLSSFACCPGAADQPQRLAQVWLPAAPAVPASAPTTPTWGTRGSTFTLSPSSSSPSWSSWRPGTQAPTPLPTRAVVCSPLAKSTRTSVSFVWILRLDFRKTFILFGKKSSDLHWFCHYHPRWQL